MKRAHDEPIETEGAVVVASPKSFRLQIGQHKLWILAGIVILIVLGIGIWKWSTRNTIPQALQITTGQTDATENQASIIAKESGIQAAIRYYNKEIPYAANDNAKAQLYLGTSDLAGDYNKQNTALQFGLKADAIMHSASSSSTVASIYQTLGNKSEAVKYYKKAANEVGTNVFGGYNKQYYLEQAQAVGGNDQ